MRTGAPRRDSAARDQDRPGERPFDPGTLYLCAQCRARIATRADRFALDGRWEAAFANPHGFWYRIGFFGAAPGCQAVGVPTTEFTWFPGLAWRIVICGCCQGHLGWSFQAVAGGVPNGFFGLVLSTLREEAGGVP